MYQISEYNYSVYKRLKDWCYNIQNKLRFYIKNLIIELLQHNTISST